MARNIRWTKSQKSALSKAVQKFNAKLTREAKKNPAITDYLPHRLNVKTLRENITTSRDLKRQIKDIEYVFKKNALQPITTAKGVQTTQYDIDRLKRLTKRANALRSKQLKELPKDPEYKGILGSIQDNMLREKKFDPDTITPGGWEKFVNKIESQSLDVFPQKRYELYKENYIKSIRNGWGSYGEKSGLIKLVEALPAETVAKAYYGSGFLQLKFSYTDFDNYIGANKVLEEWRNYLKNNNIEDASKNIIETEYGYLDKDSGELFPFPDEEDDDE